MDTAHTREFQVLQEIVETVSSTLDLQRVLQEIVRLVSEVTTADACLCYLLEDSSEVLKLYASKPAHAEDQDPIHLRVGEGLTGMVAQQKQTIVIEQRAFEDPRFRAFQQLPEDRFEAFLSVPIVMHDRLIGVINVQHRQPRVYTRETIELGETIGRLVGGAVVNAQLYDKERRGRREVEALAQVTEAVASSRYLDEILQLVVTVTAELMGSKICSLMLLDESKQELVIKATQALSIAYRNKPPIKVGQSISGEALLKRKSISVRNVTRDKRYMYPEIAKREGLRSLLCVPMRVRNRVVGVINCYTAKEHGFTGGEIQVLSSIANQAATAIEHTRLIEEAVGAREALESRKLIERAKGILIQEGRMSETEAFRRLQQQSMQKRKSMREIAEAVILMQELKDKD